MTTWCQKTDYLKGLDFFRKLYYNRLDFLSTLVVISQAQVAKLADALP
jgi:hypothetical protein